VLKSLLPPVIFNGSFFLISPLRVLGSTKASFAKIVEGTDSTYFVVKIYLSTAYCKRLFESLNPTFFGSSSNKV
jgi:hypothetical protein